MLFEDSALTGGMGSSIMILALCLVLALLRGYWDMIGRQLDTPFL
jgi:hypothetical protein